MHLFAWMVGFSCITISLFASAADGPEWTYSGERGPEYWGDLSPEFTLCKWGVNQSPVNIVDTIDAELPPLELDYSGHAVALTNNGHTLQVDVDGSNVLRVEGQEFELLQFHLHAPSEHRLNGELFLMETHLVHANKQGELAVIALLHEEGPANKNFTWLGSQAPQAKGQRQELPRPHRPMANFSGDLEYYRYNGSLTTPPCKEGVRWFVLKKPRPLDPIQQDNFVEMIGEDARGPQPINARLIMR